VSDDAAHKFLQRGDALLERGDRVGAVEQYLLYCEHLGRVGIVAGSSHVHLLRLSVTCRRILELDPRRRDVRRSLAEHYAALGLLDDARAELGLIADESVAAGDVISLRSAQERLMELAKRRPPDDADE
jgi:hypothetical protein